MPYPEIGIFEIGAIVFDNPGTVALLHDADFLDDLLQVGVNRHLFDRQHLPGFFVKSFVHRAIGALAEFADDVENLLGLPRQALLRELLQLTRQQTNKQTNK